MIREMCLLVACVALSGCVDSYADADVAAIGACKSAGLDWAYLSESNLGGTYRRVECMKPGSVLP